MYSMTPQNMNFFFYKNTQNFTLISNPWTQLEKSVHRKSYLQKNFAS
jgi:hypothetical protein